ncbi:hypothetical protein TNIN_336291 [Trichonephila inaurata madagascariensis]|uniref:Uncharacterized protein n=1 Tax=Trichonephila inaurata madagascariensis TaxID=2747483 RepID=A0A8X6WXI8_9ARAC|nr:hypothetical protein TNIN_336291 [Trichonephila inaurata madagascariensis]
MTVVPAAAHSPSSAGARFTLLDPISLKRRMAPCMRRGRLGGGPVPEGTPEPPRAAPTNPAVTPTLAVVLSGERLHEGDSDEAKIRKERKTRRVTFLI